MRKKIRVFILVISLIISLIVGTTSYITLNISSSNNINKSKDSSLDIVKTTSSSATAPTELTIETQKCSPPSEEFVDDASGDYSVEEKNSDNNDDGSFSFSTSEQEIIARVIMAESGTCSTNCLWLTGSALLNLADYYNNGDIAATANDPQIFETAGSYYNQEPTQECWNVVERLNNGDRDLDVMFFRTDYYHSFGTPYTNIDNVYFSTL